MSKLYSKYEILKSSDADCIYLFLCGNFYIALDSDAIMLNELFDMKLTKFSNVCDKCGFPKASLGKYEDKLKSEEIRYKIINNTTRSSDDIIKDIRSLYHGIDIDNMNQLELKDMIQNIEKLIVE